jgi:multiple sugar transport system substrate-binding protein
MRLKLHLALVALVAWLGLTGCQVPAQPAAPATPSHSAPTPLRQEPTPARSAPRLTPTHAPLAGLTAAQLQGVKIQFWHPWSGPTAQVIESAAHTFNATNPYDISVRPLSQGSYNDLYAQVDASLAAGAPPELVLGYTYQFLTWEKAGGRVVDLTPYLSDSQWGLTPAEQADFYPVFWQSDALPDRRVGLPVQRFAQLLYYNETWAAELGFQAPPTTAQEFKRQACAAAQANQAAGDPDKADSGGWLVNSTPTSLLSWLYAFESEPLAPGEGSYRFNTPAAQSALGFLKNLYDGGCAWQIQGALAEGDPDAGAHAQDRFAARQALFISASLADLPLQQAALDLAQNTDTWTVLAFPGGEGAPVMTVYGPSIAVFETTPERNLAAWLFLKWLTGPQVQARLAEASSTFPVRASAASRLETYAADHPQWAAALELLPTARAEPRQASWKLVRWAVGDVAAQLFRYYFTADRIPATLELLDKTAADLQAEVGE